MIKHGRFIFTLLLLVSLLSGCLSNIWTGATLVYDRHDVYKKLSDYKLLAQVNNTLYKDKLFKNERCIIDIAAFNGDVLVAGHVPSEELRYEVGSRLDKIKGYRRLYNRVKVSQEAATNVHDTWITTKIRSQIFADDSIDPNAFKIVTSDSTVFLMGDVQPKEAEKVIRISRFTSGVKQVVTMLKYYTYQRSKSMA